MKKLRIRNYSFDRISDRYAPVIDPEQFHGFSTDETPRRKGESGAVNLSKSGEMFVMEIAVPGFSKEELTVAIHDDLLVIRGLKKYKEDHPETEFILEEFDTASFERKFQVNPCISREKISAQYEAGILRLTFIHVPPEEEKSAQFIHIR